MTVFQLIYRQSFLFWQVKMLIWIVKHPEVPWVEVVIPREGGVLPEKLGGGVRPASQKPYPIYDQNMRYSLPYLWSPI